MLTQLRLHNFKSWPDTGEVQLSPITGVFGTNSSGKTSLLQALLLLKQTADSSDRGLALHFGDAATLVSLGDFKSIVYRHATETKLTIGLDWDLPRSFRVQDSAHDDRTVVEGKQLGFTTKVVGVTGPTGRGPRISVAEMAYSVGAARFGMRQIAGRSGEYKVFTENTDFELVRPVGRPGRVPAPAKCYGFPDQVRAYYQNAGFLADLELELETCLRHVYYLGPLRAYPKRQYTWAGAQPADMGQAGEQAIDAILAARERGQKISPGPKKRHVALEEYVARWLRQLGLIEDFQVRPVTTGSQVFEVTVRKARGAPEALITDVGFGVSQVLPVLVLCFYVPEGSTVILEQPEIHLHPAVQAGLADVFIDAWKKRGVQIVLESHSEHLLRRLQRRVAEEVIPNDEIALYFCAAERGKSTLTPLQLSVFGAIDNWPTGFFGDEFGEIAATQAAIIDRKRRSQG